MRRRGEIFSECYSSKELGTSCALKSYSKGKQGVPPPPSPPIHEGWLHKKGNLIFDVNSIYKASPRISF